MNLSPPASAIRYKQPALMVWFYRFVVVLSLSAGTGAAILLIPQGIVPALTAFFAILVSGGVGTYTWRAQRRAGDVFAVNDTGIWRLRENSGPVFIAWGRAIVRADDTMQRLILSDRGNTASIWLEYQLEDFAKLRDYIQGHVQSAPPVTPSGDLVFHRTWINKIIMAACVFIGLALTVICAKTWLPALFFLSLTAVQLWAIVCDPLKLTIQPDRLVISYPGWNREIALTDIISASLADELSGGNTWVVVVIELKSKKRPIKLYRFREGSLALADALQRALGRASAR